MLTDEKLLSRLAHTFFFFWGAQCVFRLVSLMLEQYLLPSVPRSLLSNVGTMSVARCFWAFNSIGYFVFYLFYCA